MGPRGRHSLRKRLAQGGDGAREKIFFGEKMCL